MQGKGSWFFHPGNQVILGPHGHCQGVWYWRFVGLESEVSIVFPGHRLAPVAIFMPTINFISQVTAGLYRAIALLFRRGCHKWEPYMLSHNHKLYGFMSHVVITLYFDILPHVDGKEHKGLPVYQAFFKGSTASKRWRCFAPARNSFPRSE